MTIIPHMLNLLQPNDIHLPLTLPSSAKLWKSFNT